MAKDHQPLIVIAIIAAIALIAFSPMTGRQEGPLTVAITPGGGETTFNLTLPPDRAYSQLVLTMSFDRVPGASFIGEQELTPTATYTGLIEEDSDNDKLDTITPYLYTLPESWGDVYQYRVKATTTATAICNDMDESGKVNAYIRGITIPYTKTIIEVCREQETENCPTTAMLYHMRRDAESDYYTSIRNQALVSSAQIVRCADEDDAETATVTINGTYTTSTEIPTSATKFIVELETKAEANPTITITQKPPLVVVDYKQSEYPSQLTYGFGPGVVDTFEGTLKGTVTTLDIAEQANYYCDRDNNLEECTVKIKLTSATGGAITIEEASTYRVATLSDKDEDGIPDVEDNCVLAVNPEQADSDSDGLGDSCDDNPQSDIDDTEPGADNDADEILNVEDNCKNTYNPSQADEDDDGVGDACDDDKEGEVIDNDPSDNNTKIPLVWLLIGGLVALIVYLQFFRKKGGRR